MSLRSKLIRLAYQNPSLRAEILPLVKTSGIEDELDGQKFPNPETGNQVSFGSLPPKAQAEIRKKFNESKEEDKKEKKEDKSEKNPYSGMSKKELTEKQKTIGNFEWSKGKALAQNKKKLEKQKNTIQYLSDVISGKKKPSGTDFDDNKAREKKLEKAEAELKEIETALKKSEEDYDRVAEKAKQIDKALKDLKSEKKATLRDNLIKLAYGNPDLRNDILPLLKTARVQSKAVKVLDLGIGKEVWSFKILFNVCFVNWDQKHCEFDVFIQYQYISKVDSSENEKEVFKASIKGYTPELEYDKQDLLIMVEEAVDETNLLKWEDFEGLSQYDLERDESYKIIKQTLMEKFDEIFKSKGYRESWIGAILA